MVSCLPLKRKFIDGFAPFGGGCYWTMSGKAARYIVTYINDHPEFLKYFKRVYIPDEIMYQTILLNSPLKDTVVDKDLRYVDWSQRETGGPPAFLDERDMAGLKSTDALIARKFDGEKDPDMLDRIDRELLK